MRTHVALLRGINVGGRNRLAMADLREIVTALGYTRRETYIQSGNVVCDSSEDDSEASPSPSSGRSPTGRPCGRASSS